MIFQTVFDQGFLVIQTTVNQLVVYNIQQQQQSNHQDGITLSLPGSLEWLTINGTNDSMAVLCTEQWYFYRLSTVSPIECNSIIKSSIPFQMALLHVDFLWLGRLTSENFLHFDIYNIAEDTHQQTQIEMNHQQSLSPPIGVELTEYAYRDGRLICALGAKTHFLLSQFQLTSVAQIELISSCSVQVEQSLSKLQLSLDNELSCFVVDTNRVRLLDNETVVQWRVKPSLAIENICFDAKLMPTLCVTTEKMLYLLHYSPTDQQLITLHTIRCKSALSVVVCAVPVLHITEADNELISHKQYPELTYLTSAQQQVSDLCDSEYKQFEHILHRGEIKLTALWQLAARRCLLHNDIHLAIFCVTKMADARLIRCVKSQLSTEGLSAACALLAMNLDITEEAEEILKTTDPKRLSNFMQVQNKWNDAFCCADKIQLKSAYYNYARQLEKKNEIADAIKYYEMSGNALEVPRMLFETGNLSQLETYCLQTEQRNEKTSAALVSWWGQYCESQSDSKTALEMYRKVGDLYNLVRLMCHLGKVEDAIRLVNEQLQTVAEQTTTFSKDITAAMLYLGKHLETINSGQSVKYYLLCGAVRHAIRVCLTNELFDQLAMIAVEHCDQAEAKRILDTHRQSIVQMADDQCLIKLYYKCGLINETIELAIECHLWEPLREICNSELSQEEQSTWILDKVLLDSVLNALKNDTSIVDIVIDLIILSGSDNFSLITQTIKDYGINVNDQLMNKLERYTANQRNAALVDTFAELCLERGNYQLAAKLYNKIGKRVDSLKALIRFGNVEKVIQFANVARDKVIFKMAGNFLQTVNYEDSLLISKFYTKAEAYQELERYKSKLELDHSKSDN